MEQPQPTEDDLTIKAAMSILGKRGVGKSKARKLTKARAQSMAKASAKARKQRSEG
jgi:molybdopterin-biosynthesis enzyme MoeA-like protein